MFLGFFHTWVKANDSQPTMKQTHGEPAARSEPAASEAR